jgi:hypothetical protein
VKDGFVRLSKLDLVGCRGYVRMFVENTPTPNLRILAYESNLETDDEIITSLASNCRALVRVCLIARLDSSVGLLKFVECCRSLESLLFADVRGQLMLERSDILAIASIPRLRSLGMIGCGVASDAHTALVRCKGLNELDLGCLADPAVLPAIGRNLFSLDLWCPSKEVADGIVEHCPNLQYLEVDSLELDEEDTALFVSSLKSGLKKLAKIKIDGKSIRLRNYPY